MSYVEKCDLCGREESLDFYSISCTVNNPPILSHIYGWPFFQERGELCNKCKKEVAKFYLKMAKEWKQFLSTLQGAVDK